MRTRKRKPPPEHPPLPLGMKLVRQLRAASRTALRYRKQVRATPCTCGPEGDFLTRPCERCSMLATLRDECICILVPGMANTVEAYLPVDQWEGPR